MHVRGGATNFRRIRTTLALPSGCGTRVWNCIAKITQHRQQRVLAQAVDRSVVAVLAVRSLMILPRTSCGPIVRRMVARYRRLQFRSS
eukprot:COSAG06_NODE_2999_length_5980_cov_4.933345_3_plen_88_part_00